MTDFTDVCVMVTGATAGFGAAATRRFIAAGARVVATGRRTERLVALRESLGDRVLPVAFDMSDREAIARAVETLPDGFADVTILVNNAGLALGLDPSASASLDDWDTMIDTNVRGLVHLTRHLLPGMVARGRGHVINISSVAANWPYPGGNVYGASKAFVSQFSRNLRSDLLGKGIRVTAIEPGLCETEFSVVRFKGDADAAKTPYQGLDPLTADDIAESIVWAASQPQHVNVNQIELMATNQAFGPFIFHRE